MAAPRFNVLFYLLIQYSPSIWPPPLPRSVSIYESRVKEAPNLQHWSYCGREEIANDERVKPPIVVHILARPADEQSTANSFKPICFDLINSSLSLSLCLRVTNEATREQNTKSGIHPQVLVSEQNAFKYEKIIESTVGFWNFPLGRQLDSGGIFHV